MPSLYRIVSGEELDERKLNYLFRIVSKMPGDRSRFVELAGRMLTSDRVRSLGSFSGALKLIRETKCMDYGPQILRRLTYDEFGIDSTVLSTLEIVATADDLKALEKKYRENASYLGSEDSPDGMAIRFKSTIRSIQKRLYPEENADGP